MLRCGKYLGQLAEVPGNRGEEDFVICPTRTGVATMTVMNEDIPDLAVPEGDWTHGHALDGRSFEILGTDVASGAVLDNTITFHNGTFQSADCQNYCNFGWSDCQTKAIDGVIHFTARTVCPDAPHTVVWYGRVAGDEVVVDGT